MDFLSFLVMAIVAMVSLSLIFLVIIGTMVTVVFARTSKLPDRGALKDDQPYKAAPTQEPSGASAQIADSAPELSGASAQTPGIAPESSDEDEFVAVISAAVAAVCGEGAKVAGIFQSVFTGAKGGLTASAWRTAGRLDNLEGL
jgi:hypothetical protein